MMVMAMTVAMEVAMVTLGAGARIAATTTTDRESTVFSCPSIVSFYDNNPRRATVTHQTTVMVVVVFVGDGY